MGHFQRKQEVSEGLQYIRGELHQSLDVLRQDLLQDLRDEMWTHVDNLVEKAFQRQSPPDSAAAFHDRLSRLEGDISIMQNRLEDLPSVILTAFASYGVSKSSDLESLVHKLQTLEEEVATLRSTSSTAFSPSSSFRRAT